jgi:hypothetical protein
MFVGRNIERHCTCVAFFPGMGRRCEFLAMPRMVKKKFQGGGVKMRRALA